MGLYIPNIEMPKDGQMLVIFPDGTAYVCFNGMRERLAQAEAVSVPPHGKLGDLDALQKQIDKAEMYREDIETYATLRRQMTTALKDMVGTDEANKDMWCMVKHLGLSMMQCFEAYENSDNNLELLNLAYEANKAFTKAVTRFLGIEISDCSACLSDALKGVK